MAAAAWSLSKSWSSTTAAKEAALEGGNSNSSCPENSDCSIDARRVKLARDWMTSGRMTTRRLYVACSQG